jgi:hypothetical protein
VDRKKISSRLLTSVAYDPVTQVLEVEWKRNKTGHRPVYQYLDVPPEKWEMFQKADSQGGYFLVFIKPNHVAKRQKDAADEEEDKTTETPAAPEE